MLMVESYIGYHMPYFVWEKSKKSGIEMMVKKDLFLPVERPLKERKSRIEMIQVL
jgi:hypothetical protein